MVDKEICEEIRRELEGARKAAAGGKAPLARVCARRAAGTAVRVWLAHNPREGWGSGMVACLQALAEDPKMPEEIRSSAAHLTARRQSFEETGDPAAPIDDAARIIVHLLGREALPPSSEQ